MNTRLSLGQALPELDLLRADGTPTTVKAHLGPWSTLLYFLHGTWCPECVGHFHLLQRYRPAILDAGADVLVVASEELEALTTFLASTVPPLDYTVLADPRHVSHHLVGARGDTLAAIVDGEGVVRWLARWLDHQAEPGYDVILQALREVSGVSVSQPGSAPA